ncbi:hypothetical protein BU14_1752s0003 [Porphyra umbilicalis]|uniref:Uncharacterized protein n=1 Tax=Porphyra umbilicalis TaxID=2786 RepID=A0A1X6NL50_PORUM|nr:hypothetical protein BU14_1752s0003 [Porphyra umbilicalis]|eukprot:OSX69196.1 hypothetical protein BU14_1752s0003 [Porphyra umbilicalis]
MNKPPPPPPLPRTGTRSRRTSTRCGRRSSMATWLPRMRTGTCWVRMRTRRWSQRRRTRTRGGTRRTWTRSTMWWWCRRRRRRRWQRPRRRRRRRLGRWRDLPADGAREWTTAAPLRRRSNPHGRSVGEGRGARLSAWARRSVGARFVRQHFILHLDTIE